MTWERRYRADCRPAAPRSPIGSFRQHQTLTEADLNDRLWSTAAGRSWDEAVIRM
ncbi:MAG: hypothetical protein ACJASD_003664 [Sphingomonas echinoides]|jgi:hypothetical protein